MKFLFHFIHFFKYYVKYKINSQIHFGKNYEQKIVDHVNNGIVCVLVNNYITGIALYSEKRFLFFFFPDAKVAQS